MHILKKLAVAIPFCISSVSVHAHSNFNLQQQRVQTIKQYMSDLQLHDADHISSLFTSNGTVVSTSQGYKNAREFFHSFLPMIQSANAVDNGIFKGLDNDSYTANFSFSWKMIDGDKSGGHYSDTFIFAAGSAKLDNVVMYENLKTS